jgi:hypothetical protein
MLSCPSLMLVVLWPGQWVMWTDHSIIVQCPRLPTTYPGICPSGVPTLPCGLSSGQWLEWSWIVRIWNYLHLVCSSYPPSSLSYQLNLQPLFPGGLFYFTRYYWYRSSPRYRFGVWLYLRLFSCTTPLLQRFWPLVPVGPVLSLLLFASLFPPMHYLLFAPFWFVPLPAPARSCSPLSSLPGRLYGPPGS